MDRGLVSPGTASAWPDDPPMSSAANAINLLRFIVVSLFDQVFVEFHEYFGAGHDIDEIAT
jgi:hypothetical protein